jgi:hypothetical protein
MNIAKRKTYTIGNLTEQTKTYELKPSETRTTYIIEKHYIPVSYDGYRTVWRSSITDRTMILILALFTLSIACLAIITIQTDRNEVRNDMIKLKTNYVRGER